MHSSNALRSIRTLGLLACLGTVACTDVEGMDPKNPQRGPGELVGNGDPITDGPFDPKEIMEIKGIRETQLYLVEEVQKVYRDQGVSIHDKHIELIVRQMTRRVSIQDPGDTDFLPGERVDARIFAEVNRQMLTENRKPAEARPELMGITKASLATDSWLSAASFQETTRVLTEAAIGSRSDSLLGLKENIIIGKLIPAGTGMGNYRDPAITAPDSSLTVPNNVPRTNWACMDMAASSSIARLFM